MKKREFYYEDHIENLGDRMGRLLIFKDVIYLNNNAFVRRRKSRSSTPAH